MNTCETCRFVLVTSGGPQCRRRAPVPIAWAEEVRSLESGAGGQTFRTVDGFFPTTDGLGCGEHEPKETS